MAIRSSARVEQRLDDRYGEEVVTGTLEEIQSKFFNQTPLAVTHCATQETREVMIVGLDWMHDGDILRLRYQDFTQIDDEGRVHISHLLIEHSQFGCRGRAILWRNPPLL